MWYIKHKQTEANEGGTIWVIRDTLWLDMDMEYGVWSDGRWSSAAGAGVWWWWWWQVAAASGNGSG
jgi:hypothetical protein